MKSHLRSWSYSFLFYALSMLHCLISVYASAQSTTSDRPSNPELTPISQLPNLEFNLSFLSTRNARLPSQEIITRSYTLAGPRDGGLLLPGMRVIAEATRRYFYGAESQQVLEIDSHTGAIRQLESDSRAPDLSWPVGITWDSRRQRIILATLSGEGFLFSYTPNSRTWTRLASLKNLDLDSLEYHERLDSFFGVGVHSGGPSLMVHQFSSSGVKLKDIRLSAQPFNVGFGNYRSELVSVGDYLVLLLEPDFRHSNSSIQESRMYLIDPRNSRFWLTYRKIWPNWPPRTQLPTVQIAAPANNSSYIAGDIIRLSAIASDPDGAIKSIEFFANGQSIAKGTSSSHLTSFEFEWRNVPAGTYNVTARAVDDFGGTATSTQIRITVRQRAEPPIALNFNLGFYDPTPAAGLIQNVSFYDYSLSGPRENLPLFPGLRIVADRMNRYFFTISGQQVLRIEARTGRSQSIRPPRPLPELSWPVGITVDRQTGLILIATLGGEGFLYAYDPATDSWTTASNLQNIDLDSITSHSDGFLYGLEKAYNENQVMVLHRFSTEGEHLSSLRVAEVPFRIGGGQYRSQLVSAGTYLVLMLEPDQHPPNSSSQHLPESRIYLINLKTSEVRLTYQRQWSAWPPLISRPITRISDVSSNVTLLPRDLSISKSGTSISLITEAPAGEEVTIEFSDSLIPGEWTTWTNATSDGSGQILVRPDPNTPQRFYRIKPDVLK